MAKTTFTFTRPADALITRLQTRCRGRRVREIYAVFGERRKKMLFEEREERKDENKLNLFIYTAI